MMRAQGTLRPQHRPWLSARRALSSLNPHLRRPSNLERYQNERRRAAGGAELPRQPPRARPPAAAAATAVPDAAPQEEWWAEAAGEEMGPAFQATLRMLDWPTLAQQVAAFAQTKLGQAAVAGMLPAAQPGACQALLQVCGPRHYSSCCLESPLHQESGCRPPSVSLAVILRQKRAAACRRRGRWTPSRQSMLLTLTLGASRPWRRAHDSLQWPDSMQWPVCKKLLAVACRGQGRAAWPSSVPQGQHRASTGHAAPTAPALD